MPIESEIYKTSVAVNINYHILYNILFFCYNIFPILYYNTNINFNPNLSSKIFPILMFCTFYHQYQSVTVQYFRKHHKLDTKNTQAILQTKYQYFICEIYYLNFQSRQWGPHSTVCMRIQSLVAWIIYYHDKCFSGYCSRPNGIDGRNLFLVPRLRKLDWVACPPIETI